jgi:predicted enzyme related to lactoylglutathione lyase
MTINARYAHTNIVAEDWQRLAQFYQDVFGCEPLPPQRHHAGQWLVDVTGIPGANLEGIHLRLPGYSGDNAPTLEIFQYRHAADRPRPAAANRPGFAHIAFAVDDVEAARKAVLAVGGGELGELVTVDIPGAGRITLIYVTDPEGNIIELQRWG